MKLSELKKIAEEKGISLDELIDDETGVSFKDMRGRYTKFDEVSKQNEQFQRQVNDQAQQLNGAMQQVHQFRTQLDQARTQNQPGPGATQAQIDRAWQQEALYQPLVSYLNHLEHTIATAGHALANFYQAHVEQAQQYQSDRQAMMRWVDARDVERMQAKYTDFDEAKVRETAKKHNVNDWDAAYGLWHTGTEGDRIKKAQEETRAATLKEFEDKGRAPLVTEMGGTNPAPTVGGPNGGPGGGEKKEYNQAWQGLADEIKGLGF